MQILTGIYEQVINQVIDNELKEIDLNENIIDKTSIDSAEAQHILSEYLAQVIEKGQFALGSNIKTIVNMLRLMPVMRLLQNYPKLLIPRIF